MDSIMVFYKRLISYYTRLPDEWKRSCFRIDCVIAVGLIVLVLAKRISIKKGLAVLLLVAYYMLVLTGTVFARNVVPDSRIIVGVLWKFRLIWQGQSYLIGELIYNILMFIPLGILTPGIRGDVGVGRIFAVGVFSSLVIEVLQIAYKCGYFETSDIVCNSLGMIVGYVVYRFMAHIARYFCLFFMSYLMQERKG
jgi:glycopeptide antibiotics resistance protein